MYVSTSAAPAVLPGGALGALFGPPLVDRTGALWDTKIYQRRPSSDPDRATGETIGDMIYAIRKDWNSLPVLLATAQAIRGARTAEEKLAGIFRWVKAHVRYVHDDKLLRRIFGHDDKLDFIIDPSRLLTMPEPQGDCDDFAALTAAMMIAAGLPVGLVTIAHKAENPRMWTHVYAISRIGGATIGMDTAEGPSAGWEPPFFYRRFEWPVPVDQEAYRERLAGLGGYIERGLGGLAKGFDWSSVLHGVGNIIEGFKPGMGQIDWGSITQGGFQTLWDIGKARLAVPPTGTYIQQGPGGTIVSRPSPYGPSASSFPSFSNFSLSPMLLLVIAAVLLFMGRR